MTKMRSALRDNLVAGVLVVLLVVLSFTTVVNMRSLSLIRECVLPEGSLCKGNPDSTANLVHQLEDRIVSRVNAHIDEVVK